MSQTAKVNYHILIDDEKSYFLKSFTLLLWQLDKGYVRMIIMNKEETAFFFCHPKTIEKSEKKNKQNVTFTFGDFYEYNLHLES